MPPKRAPPDAGHQRTPSTRSVRRRVSPASHSPAATRSLRHIPPDSPVWADPATNCLSLGLNPSDTIHSGVICDKCLYFWEQKLSWNLDNLANEERSGSRMICERPFDCSKDETNSKYKYKLKARDKLKGLFASPGLSVSPATEPVMRSSIGPSGPVDKSTTNRGPLKLFNDNGSISPGGP